MPLRPGLLELGRWAEGGPDGRLAFSSLAPNENKVYVRQAKPRATEKARWLRDSLSATRAALGSAVSSLIQQREKVVEAVPMKSGIPDDLRQEMMARNSPGKIPDDVDSLFSTANKTLSPQHKDDEVKRWRSKPTNNSPKRFLTEASQDALKASKRANEIRRKFEEAPELPCDEQADDDDDYDDDYYDDGDNQQSAWRKMRSSGTRTKIQSLSRLGRQRKARSKMTEEGKGAGGDPFLPEGQDLDSVASEPSLDRVESEASAQGRTLQEGEDLGSCEFSSMSKDVPLPATPRPKTAHVSRLTFSDDSSPDSDADMRARQALGAVKKMFAERFHKKSFLKRSSTVRSVNVKRPSQVIQRHSLHQALFGKDNHETAPTSKVSDPRKSSKNDPRAKASSAPDSDATLTQRRVDIKQKGQSNLKPLPFKVISWSSQKRGPQNAASNLEAGSVTSNTRWETNGKPEHWILLDLHQECEVSGCSLRFTGTQLDPKNVTLMRGGPEIEGMVQKGMSMTRRSTAAVETAPLDTTLLMSGTWIVAKRSTLSLSPSRTHHKMAFSAVTARYWRLIFHDSNSSTGNIRVLAPLQMHGIPVPSDDTADLSRRPSLTSMFTEAFNLGHEERETRRLAREYAVPIDYAEYVRKEFVRYDTSGTGALDYADFSKVVQTMSRQKASVSRTRDEKIPESRIRKLWQNVDTDGSGFVEFNEFLLWFYHNFNSDSRYATKSFHSNKLADSATENFYASMGCNRLRCFVDSQIDMEEAKERAALVEGAAVEIFEPLEPAAPRDTAQMTAALAKKVKGQVKMKLFKNAMSKNQDESKNEPESGIQ